jgi:CheY-like chemotaxis protein
MTIDDAIKIIEAVTKLIGVLAWPSILLFVLIRFAPGLRDFFSSIGEFSLKAAGFEASAKRIQTEAAAALAAATASKPDIGATPESTAKEAKAIASFVADSVTPRVIRRLSRASIIWVDDRPNNNVYERKALEAVGITFVISTSTDDALTKLKDQKFDAIISDMGRPPDPQAGYTLLDRLRSSGDLTPFIIYAGSRAAEHRAEARRRGAIGCTNRPDELFDMVLMALSRSA